MEDIQLISVEEAISESRKCASRNALKLTSDRVCRECRTYTYDTLTKFAKVLGLRTSGSFSRDDLCHMIGDEFAKQERQKNVLQLNPNTTTIEHLPFDIQKTLLSKMDTASLLNACKVNSTIRGLCNDIRTWKYLWSVKHPGKEDVLPKSRDANLLKNE